MKQKTTNFDLNKFRKKYFNKFLIAFLIFAGWLLFFDKYNFFAQMRLKKSTTKLELEYAKLKEDIRSAEKEKQELELNQEKYGREKYFLHKDNEDVFIIDKKN